MLSGLGRWKAPGVEAEVGGFCEELGMDGEGSGALMAGK